MITSLGVASFLRSSFSFISEIDPCIEVQTVRVGPEGCGITLGCVEAAFEAWLTSSSERPADHVMRLCQRLSEAPVF